MTGTKAKQKIVVKVTIEYKNIDDIIVFKEHDWNFSALMACLKEYLSVYNLKNINVEVVQPIYLLEDKVK